MNTALDKFCDALCVRLNEYKQRMGLTYFDKYKVEYTLGKKYAKVSSVEIDKDGAARHGNLVAFVDIATGDIFKPAGWASPAKHARGNVNSAQNGMEAISAQGHVFYLR